jgi:hypothetical protein
MTDHEFKAPGSTTALDETTARLTDIRERVHAATEGPWDLDCTRVDVNHDDPVGIEWGVTCDALFPTGVAEEITIHADAEFIAAARADVPWLLSEVERLTAERDRARDLAARLEAQVARVAEAVNGMETLRYAGMTTRSAVSDVEAAARTQRAVRAHAADLRDVLDAPENGGE